MHHRSQSVTLAYTKGAMLQWHLETVEVIYELIVIFKTAVRINLSFVKWCIIVLEIANRRWVHCGQ